MKFRPTVFFDRDGTLMEEVNYCSRPEDVRLLHGVANSLRRLQKKHYWSVIITNQAGIGRGLFTEADYQRVQAELLRQIGEFLIKATYFCPEHPDHATRRRKPGTGMIEEACRDLPIDLTQSWFIGDKASDIECGQAAGLRTILVETGYGKTEKCSPDFRAKDLATAIDHILLP